MTNTTNGYEFQAARKLANLAEFIRSHGNVAIVRADGSIRIGSDGSTAEGFDCSFIDDVKGAKEARAVLGY